MGWWRIAAWAVISMTAGCMAPLDAVHGGGPQYLAAAEAPGPFASRCVADIERDVRRLAPDPTSNLAYWSDAGERSVVRFHARRRVLDHRQGIQRLHIEDGPDRGNYLLVTASTRRGDPGFEVIRLGSRTEPGALGATATRPGDAPTDHRVIGWITHDNRRAGTNYNHAGGLQIMGRVAVVAMEAWRVPDPPRAGFALYWLEPSSGHRGALIPRQSAGRRGSVAHAGSAGIARLQDGRYLVMVFGRGAGEVEVFLSAEPSLSFDQDQWNSMGAWSISARDRTLVARDMPWLRYQNTQLLAQCDGQLFLLASGQQHGRDMVHLWRVTLGDAFEPRFIQITQRHLVCKSRNTHNRRYCSLQAGGGPYVDIRGRLIFYGVKGGSRGAPVGVREFTSTSRAAGIH